MIVLDTHAWLWWMTRDPRLSAKVKRRIDATEVGIASMSCFELVLLERRSRVALDRNVRSWIEFALARDGVRALALDATVATEAALIDPLGFPADPADRIIYATARAHGAVLATKDERIRAHDPERTLW